MTFSCRFWRSRIRLCFNDSNSLNFWEVSCRRVRCWPSNFWYFVITSSKVTAFGSILDAAEISFLAPSCSGLGLTAEKTASRVIFSAKIAWFSFRSFSTVSSSSAMLFSELFPFSPSTPPSSPPFFSSPVGASFLTDRTRALLLPEGETSSWVKNCSWALRRSCRVSNCFSSVSTCVVRDALLSDKRSICNLASSFSTANCSFWSSNSATFDTIYSFCFFNSSSLLTARAISPRRDSKFSCASLRFWILSSNSPRSEASFSLMICFMSECNIIFWMSPSGEISGTKRELPSSLPSS
mmetsp:Transcript_36606/g.57462  ORF Transcript_36606/g.57462 Transcript_36606/m.57462 type:complete len:296 (+) Transcript_36606:610-1497(+)